MKSLRVTTSVLLIIIGASTSALSIYALFHIRDLTIATLLLSAFLLGVAIVLAGTAIARGESIRDLFRDLLSAISI